MAIATALQEARETEKVEAVEDAAVGIFSGEERINLAEERCEAAQIHLIVANHCRQRLGGASAKIVKIVLGDEGGDNVVLAVPADLVRIEDMAFEFDQAHRAEAQLPQSACGMKQVEMRGEAGNGDGAGHSEAIFEQRPIEGLAVEGDENGALRKTRGEFVKNRVLFGEVAHEELFDLQAAGIPPCQADEKGVGSGASGEAGGFGVEEEPLLGVLQGEARVLRERFVAGAGEQFKGKAGRLGEFRSGAPVADDDVLAKTIVGDACAENPGQNVAFIWRAQIARSAWDGARGL